MTRFPAPSLRFEAPHAGKRDSYLAHVAEFKAARELLVPFVLGFPAEDFEAFLQRLADCARGAEIAKGFVAHRTFWLVDGRGEVVAVSNLRLELTPALRRDGGHIGFGVRPSARRRGYATMILRESLREAKRHGIARALVTCHQRNVGSAGAIRNNGGVLDSEEKLEGHDDILQCYWIDTELAHLEGVR
jgi:predicted acetyltransferase